MTNKHRDLRRCLCKQGSIFCQIVSGNEEEKIDYHDGSTPKVREHLSPDCSRQRIDENMMQKIIDGSETGVNEFPW